MALKIVTGPENAPAGALRGRTIAVLGYGNQGSAHALNLRDSGHEVIVANRTTSDNGRRAAADGFRPREIDEAVAAAGLVIVALPDEEHESIWAESIAPNLRPGTVVGFLHGFSIRYGFVTPATDVGVIMVAPKGPGRTLRARFTEGLGIPCLFAVHQEPAGAAPGGAGGATAEAVGLAWANGIGCARAAIVYTSFADEAETDLFGEQAVLCGGLSELILAAFGILVEAGYPPELAYMECCQEVKQVADIIYERGLSGTMRAISNTAEFGAYKAGPVIVDDAVRERLRRILAEVRDGTFAAGMRRDHASGFGWFHDRRRAGDENPIESAGASVRDWMPWLAGPSAPPAASPPGTADAAKTIPGADTD